MTEKKYFVHEDSNYGEKRRNVTDKLILAALLVIIVLLVFMFINSGITNSTAGSAATTEGGFFSAAAGSCCSVDSPRFGDDESLTRGALDYYRESGGDITGIKTVVDDYGCHKEISLVREGELVKRYSYLGSEFLDITP